MSYITYGAVTDAATKIYNSGAQAGYAQGYQKGYNVGKREAITKLPYRTNT